MKTNLILTAWLAVVFLGSLSQLTAQTMTLVPASNTNIQYIGRVDQTNPDKVIFAYPGVSIKAKFEGTAIDAVIKDYSVGGTQTTTYFYQIIDGGTPTKLKVLSSQTTYQLARSLAAGTHTIELVKITESSVGKVEFQGFQVESGKTLVAPDALPTRKIEIIGNSISCGYGIEKNYTAAQLATNGGFNSVNENNYLSYGSITARNLGAQFVCTAYSGRGLYMNNSGSTTGTLPKIYDQTIADQTTVAWSSSKYSPDVIVINLGTNDFAAEATGVGTVVEATFKSTYVSFIGKLRGYYPNATIICAVGCMMSDWYPSGTQAWTRIQTFVSSVVSQVKAAGDNKVLYYKFEPQVEPYGEDWHPSTATQASMATALTSFINTNVTWGTPLTPVSVALNDSKVYYDGTWYSDVQASKVMFNRHTPDAYNNTESGYYGTWIRQWVNTQTGIRIRFKTNSPSIKLTFESRADGGHVIDPMPKGFNIFADGKEIMATASLNFTISNPTPGTTVTYEVSLPDLYSVNFTGLTIDGGYTLTDPGPLNKPVYAAIGNSITHGTGQYCESSKTYPFLLAQTLGWDVHNLAVAGASVGWATALNVKGKTVDKISVALGYNDWFYEATALSAKQTMYTRLIDSLRKFQPAAKIYCLAPLTTTTTSGNAAPYTLEQFRQMVKTLVLAKQAAGDDKIFFIYGPDISDASMLDDGVHLNEYGAKKIAASLAAFIDSSTVQHGNPSDTAIASVNYAADGSRWSAYVDDLGSQIVSLVKTGPVVANFNQAAQTNPALWPWVTLGCTLDAPLTGTTYIKVTYKCNTELIITLPQAPLDASGESYQFTLPASSTYKTMMLKISDFTQPSWASTIVPLNLDIISGIAFAPIVASTGGSAIVDIKDLISYQAGTLTDAISQAEANESNLIKIYKLSNSSLSVNIKERGAYSLYIYSIDGRLVCQQNDLHLNAGLQTIAWNGQNCNDGLYVIGLNKNGFLTTVLKKME